MHRLCFLTLLFALVLPAIAMAQQLAKPNGEIVLTIEGAIGNGQFDGRADFDMDMLRALPAVTIRTSSPWTAEPMEYTGVPMAALLELVQAKGRLIRAEALNDYIAQVDLETVRDKGAILAYLAGGKEISIRDKGPLWIMFPFDDRPELKAEQIYAQSVWQLRRLTIEE